MKHIEYNKKGVLLIVLDEYVLLFIAFLLAFFLWLFN